MASRPSPSSSSDVEDEETDGMPPQSKRSRLQLHHLAPHLHHLPALSRYSCTVWLWSAVCCRSSSLASSSLYPASPLPGSHGDTEPSSSQREGEAGPGGEAGVSGADTALPLLATLQASLRYLGNTESIYLLTYSHI